MQKRQPLKRGKLILIQNKLRSFKVESINVYFHFHANPYISPIAHFENICIFTEAICVSLDVLWLDVKVVKVDKVLSLSFLYP